MKKFILLATTALLVTGVSVADNGKNKKKKHGKCCTKSGSCHKNKAKTAGL